MTTTMLPLPLPSWQVDKSSVDGGELESAGSRMWWSTLVMVTLLIGALRLIVEMRLPGKFCQASSSRFRLAPHNAPLPARSCGPKLWIDSPCRRRPCKQKSRARERQLHCGLPGLDPKLHPRPLVQSEPRQRLDISPNAVSTSLRRTL